MKTKIRNWMCHFIVIGFILLLTNNCKKDLTDTVIIIPDTNDTDTNFYPASVTIGTQIWMTKNLKTRRYTNGDKIWTTTPATLDISAELTPKYQWAYDADEINVDTYGRLYTWYAITDIRGVCPRGWHVPTDEDWTILTTYLEGKLNGTGSLKETGTTHWAEPNAGATNATDFSALPGGYRFSYGTFNDIGFSGFYWSSSEFSDLKAYCRGFVNYNSQVTSFNFYKREGLSVRCIKDN